MKKQIVLSVVALGLLSSVSVQAADDLSSMFSEGKASGEIRMFYIDREYQGSSGADTHRNSTAVGGNLKLETADYKGLSFGTALYTTNEIPVLNYTNIDPTLLGVNNKSYSILGEAYLQYKYENTIFKGGRQKLNTPMAGADDARMLPNMFEAYLLINSDIPNTTLIAGHVSKFAQGTFGRVYDAASSPANSILSATAGYSAVDSRNQVGDFVNAGTYAVGQSTDGVSVASASYKNGKFNAQVWDYFAHDIVNIIYADASISWNCLLTDSIKPYASVQLINESDIGDSYAGSLGGMYWGAKIGAKYENFNAYVAYSQASENDAGDAASENAIISVWGGMPAYTQGMVTRHQFLAGTKATKVAASYDFKDMGANVSAAAYYVSFDMDANSGYGIARTATEPGFDIKYKPATVKNLQLRLRGNFPRSFAEGATGDTGWNEYRVIANYTF